MILFPDEWERIRPRRLGIVSGQAEKGDTMEELMTDFQFKKIIEMVYSIIDKCQSIEEVKAELQKLMDD